MVFELTPIVHASQNCDSACTGSPGNSMPPQASSHTVYNVTCMSDSQRDLGLEIEFIDHFNTQLVITLNYSIISNLYTSQITRAHY
jgi:hypothetical protein